MIKKQVKTKFLKVWFINLDDERRSLGGLAFRIVIIYNSITILQPQFEMQKHWMTCYSSLTLTD